MILLAIDPGTTQSAWVLYDTEAKKPTAWGKEANEQVRFRLTDNFDALATGEFLALEMLQSYGMPAGREMFETAVWIGRFMEAWCGGDEDGVARLYRPTVKAHLCGSAKAKDANVRAAIVDRFGGKDVAVGSKKAPGPLYGVKADCWAALALAIAWAEGARS